MNALSLEEIADIPLGGAKQHGATAADVVVAEGDALTVGVRLGKAEKAQRARGKHLGLRAFAGERSAIRSTADFARPALEQLAADPVALARVTAPDPFSGLPDSGELATSPPTLDLFDAAVGLFAGWLRERTGTIAVPAAYHGFANLLYDFMARSMVS